MDEAEIPMTLTPQEQWSQDRRVLDKMLADGAKQVSSTGYPEYYAKDIGKGIVTQGVHTCVALANGWSMIHMGADWLVNVDKKAAFEKMLDKFKDKGPI